MCVSLYKLISFLSTSFQFWPCMKMSSSARHQGAPEEVMSTATVAPTGGTATWDHCTLLVHDLQYPANVFDFLPNQSLRLSHCCCREGLQASGWEPEMQTSTWSLTEVCCYKFEGFSAIDVGTCRKTFRTNKVQFSSAVDWSWNDKLMLCKNTINTIIIEGSVGYFIHWSLQNAIYFKLSKQT